VRQRYVAEHGLPLKKKAAVSMMGSRGMQSLARLGQLPFVRDGMLRGAPFMGDQLSWRSLPALASKPLHARKVLEEPAPAQVSGSQAAGARVAYFPACITDLMEPETGEGAVKVLRALGCDVSMPEGWTCCGLVAHNAGDAPQAKRLLKETVRALERDDAPAIVSTSTSCATMLTQDALHLLRDEPEWQARAEAVGKRVMDFARFVDGVARLPAGALAGAGHGEPVTYHDACQSFNCLGLGPEARRILRDVCGLELREMQESSVCCGFGGTFSLQHPDVAKQILARKLENVQATGASRVVTDNPGCLMHIRGGLRAAGRAERASHLAEILAERLDERWKRAVAPGAGPLSS
jgi:L-lactate dehydrogenase complex protein LldF